MGASKIRYRHCGTEGCEINKLFRFPNKIPVLFYRRGRKVYTKGTMPLRPLRKLCALCGKISQQKVESLLCYLFCIHKSIVLMRF
jgi:hypothetical protein